MVALPSIDKSYGTQMQQSYRRKRIELGDGYSVRALEGLNAKPQVWKIIYDNVTKEEAEELRVFFETLGGVDLIEWQPYNQPDELKWTATDFQSQPSTWQKLSCSVVLTQEFDL